MVMLQYFHPISFTMNQAEMHTHTAVCKPTSNSARDCSSEELNKDLSELTGFSSTNHYIVEGEVENSAILRFPWSWGTLLTAMYMEDRPHSSSQCLSQGTTIFTSSHCTIDRMDRGAHFWSPLLSTTRFIT